MFELTTNKSCSCAAGRVGIARSASAQNLRQKSNLRRDRVVSLKRPGRFCRSYESGRCCAVWSRAVFRSEGIDHVEAGRCDSADCSCLPRRVYDAGSGHLLRASIWKLLVSPGEFLLDLPAGATVWMCRSLTGELPAAGAARSSGQLPRCDEHTVPDSGPDSTGSSHPVPQRRCRSWSVAQNLGAES